MVGARCERLSVCVAEGDAVTMRCSECGGVAMNGINVRDAANNEHRYHVDCWAHASWWLNGNDGAPSHEYIAKVRATYANAKVTP